MTGTELAQVGTKEVTLHAAPVGVLEMVNRAASDPNFDPTKFQTLVDFCRHERDRSAREAFNAAMVACQSEMRPIEADATNPQTRSKYATYTKLDKALRPIYNRHGFSLSFNTTDSPVDQHMRVLGYVSHASGHSVTYQIDIPADGKGAKGNDVMTKTHAVGAGASYGMRYLLKMIFNVLVGEDDTDGNVSHQEAVAPDGFFGWLQDLEASADMGTTALNAAWKASKELHRTHLAKHYADKREAIRKRAVEADKAAK